MSSEERIQNIEEKSLYVERHVEELDEVVRGLADQLDKMQRELARISRRIEEMASAGEVDVPDEG